MAEDSSRLSEEELNALASDEGFDDDSASLIDPEAALSAEIRPHNLVTEDTTIGINLAAVDMITERFTRHLRLGLLEVLRTSPRITADRVGPPFSEYLQDLQAPLSVTRFACQGCEAHRWWSLIPTWSLPRWITFWWVWARYRGATPGPDVHSNRTRLSTSCLRLFSPPYMNLGSHYGDSCEHVGSEINPQFVQIVDENDLVIVCTSRWSFPQRARHN